MLEAVQQRLDKNPQAMRLRRETAEHPFGTLKMRMGATHFLMKRLPKVATEMSLHVLAYNLTRVMNIIGVKPFRMHPILTALSVLVLTAHRRRRRSQWTLAREFSSTMLNDCPSLRASARSLPTRISASLDLIRDLRVCHSYPSMSLLRR